eukprot:570172-Lingulodinium_polyedra.AAC.1
MGRSRGAGHPGQRRPPPKPATIPGDQGIAKYRANMGRLRDPELHGVLDGPLAHAACRPRKISWLA